MFRTLLLVLAACAGTPPASGPESSSGEAPPDTRTEAVTDAYHGVEVTEEYRWLEDGSDSAVQAWSQAQDAHARAFLSGLPGRDALRDDLAGVLKAEVVGHWPVAFGGDTLFAMRDQPPKQRAFLVTLPSIDDVATPHVVVDPNLLDPEGLTGIDWFRPSPDGSLVAVSLSRAGTEVGDVHIYDVATATDTGEVVPRVNGGTAGGDLVWAADGSGFWYTRYPRDGERDAADMSFYVQAWWHQLGTPTADDRRELGEGFPRIAEIDLDVHHGTGRVLATMQDGDGGEFAHYLREPDGTWRQLSELGDGNVMIVFSESGEHLYAVALEGSPRGRILRMPVGGTVADAEIVVAEGDDTVVTSFWGIPSIRELGGRLYVTYQLGGPSEIRAFAVDGTPATAPDQPAVASVGSMTPTPDGGLLFSASSFVQPWTWYRFDPAAGATRALPLNEAPPVDLSDADVRRELAVSKDGTKVPVNIVAPAGVELDGTNPCIVTGYGGYGISLSPRFRAEARVLLDRGVVLVVANLRGGGEFGEAWHLAGNLTHKQNVFDDFHGVLAHLVERGWTRPDRTGIMGGSNGGLLMGAVLTQRPESFAAAVSAVGIYDMLRVELSPNGAFNVTEFGTVADEAQFRAMYAYSPYHRVVDGTAYPPTLFTTGANDPRVDPMHSRKMTARLQAATSGDAPILLRTDSRSGHGGASGLDSKVELLADEYAFLLGHIGVELARDEAVPSQP